MTKKFKFALMSCVLVLGASMASCSSDDSPKGPSAGETLSNILVKSPEMVAYSGGNVLSKYGARGEGEEVTPSEQGYVSHNDVEINLSLNDEIPMVTPGEGEEFEAYSKDYTYSHLSLHLRTARDVKVRIPVPAEFYCPADDMEIVKKHAEGEFEYGEYEDTEHTLSINIAGQTVTVSVVYDAEGITITTNGMNQAVIDYLAEEYEDGLTFEIWNYYNVDHTRTEIQDYLNQSTVEFLEGYDNVDYYVNAINELKTYDEETGEVATQVTNELDCTVDIIAAQAEGFEAITPGSEEYLDGFHGYNGSEKNRVFKRIVEDEEEPAEEPDQAPSEE